MKEILAITSHPSLNITMKETNKIIKDVKNIDIDMIYASHYSKLPKEAIKKCKYIFIDKYNPILGFNTPKEYDYILTPNHISENQVFTNTEVSVSNTFAHFLLLKNSIMIAKNNGYDYYYGVVFDVFDFFNTKNLDTCFYPLRENIKDNDVVGFPLKMTINSKKGRSNMYIFDSKIFALNLKSKLVDEFFNKYNDVKDWATLHDKWNPVLKKYFKINQKFFVCDFLELLFTLEIQNFKTKLLDEEIPNGSSGFFESLIENQDKEILRRKQKHYSHDVEECRKKLNVIRT